MNRALQWKLIAGFLLVFVAGGITGAFVGGSYARHHFFELHRPERIGAQMKERLRAELNLTRRTSRQDLADHRQDSRATAGYPARHRPARPSDHGRGAPGRWLPISQMSSGKNFSKSKSDIDGGVIITFTKLPPKCRRPLRSR